jgi:hypothetical protein
MKKFSVFLLTMLAIALAFTACGGNGGGGGETYEPLVYTSTADSGDTYKLTITPSGRAAFTPQANDSYTLVITYKNGNPGKTSTGTIQAYVSGTFTLAKGTVSFTVTVTGGDMTQITGSIPIDNEEPVTAPGAVTPQKDGNNGGDDGSTVDKIIGSTWTSAFTEQIGTEIVAGTAMFKFIDASNWSSDVKYTTTDGTVETMPFAKGTYEIGDDPATGKDKRLTLVQVEDVSGYNNSFNGGFRPGNTATFNDNYTAFTFNLVRGKTYTRQQ